MPAALTFSHSNFWFHVGCSVAEMTYDFCSLCLPSLKVQKGSDVVPSLAGSSAPFTSRTSSAPCSKKTACALGADRRLGPSAVR